MQYGHSLKEQGKYGEAEAAYRQAIKLRPRDPDAHLQLGHVLKLMDRAGESREEYAASMRLKPTRAAFDELDSLKDTDTGCGAVTATAAELESSDAVYLEVDDLLDYLRSHRTVSGIQRVQVGIVTHAIVAIEQGDRQYRIVRTARSGRGFLQFVP